MSRIVLITCALALVIQSISACGYGCGGYSGVGYGRLGYGGIGYGRIGYGGLGTGYGAGVANLAASNGPGLAVSSASPMIPVGVSVLSENAYGGELAVCGALPFLGTIALEGRLPTAGYGAIGYRCGNGAVGMSAEDGYGYGHGGGLGFGYGYGLGGYGDYDGYGGYGGCGYGWSY